MRRRRLPAAIAALALAPVLGLVFPAADADEPRAWPERIEALRGKRPDTLVVALPLGAGLVPSPIVRVERASDVATFVDTLARAEPSTVLLGPNPLPEVGRLTLLARGETLLVVSATARAFRVETGPGSALTFRSAGLLQWTKDRLTAPDRRLLPPRTAVDTAPLVEAFSKATAGAAPAAPSRKTLVVNGTFEEAATGVESPLAWDRMDRLTSFWVLDRVDPAAHGRVVLLDTDVYESEWKRRQEEMARDPDSPPWPKTPVPESAQYATVGGNHGVSVYGAPIPVELGRPYRISLACRTDLASGVAKVWVRGYGALATARGVEERRLFDALSTVRLGSPGWKSHTFVFHPTKSTPAVATMRVMLYAYWPRGRYAFDDVALVAISDEEYARAKETERSDVK